MIKGGLLHCTSANKLQSFKSITFPSTFESVSSDTLFSFGLNNHICDLIQIIFKNPIPPYSSGGYIFQCSNNVPEIVNKELKIYVPYSEDDSVLNAYKNSYAFSQPTNIKDCIISLNQDGTIPSI